MGAAHAQLGLQGSWPQGRRVKRLLPPCCPAGSVSQTLSLPETMRTWLGRPAAGPPPPSLATSRPPPTGTSLCRTAGASMASRLRRRAWKSRPLMLRPGRRRRTVLCGGGAQRVGGCARQLGLSPLPSLESPPALASRRQQPSPRLYAFYAPGTAATHAAPARPLPCPQGAAATRRCLGWRAATTPGAGARPRTSTSRRGGSWYACAGSAQTCATPSSQARKQML